MGVEWMAATQALTDCEQSPLVCDKLAYELIPPAVAGEYGFGGSSWGWVIPTDATQQGSWLQVHRVARGRTGCQALGAQRRHPLQHGRAGRPRGRGGGPAVRAARGGHALSPHHAAADHVRPDRARPCRRPRLPRWPAPRRLSRRWTTRPQPSRAPSWRVATSRPDLGRRALDSGGPDVMTNTDTAPETIRSAGRIARIRGPRDRTWAFLLPAYGAILAVVGVPVVYSLYLSFHQWKLTTFQKGVPFVGLDNYARAISGRRLLAFPAADHRLHGRGAARSRWCSASGSPCCSTRPSRGDAPSSSCSCCRCSSPTSSSASSGASC